jgi:hypothetical protein
MFVPILLTLGSGPTPLSQAGTSGWPAALRAAPNKGRKMSAAQKEKDIAMKAQYAAKRNAMM